MGYTLDMDAASKDELVLHLASQVGHTSQRAGYDKVPIFFGKIVIEENEKFKKI